MNTNFEIFEHTADLGIRVRAETLEDLFATAAAALFSIMVADTERIRPRRRFTFRVEGDKTDELLLDWLDELLFVCSARQVLLVKFAVKIVAGVLTAEAWGEHFDPCVHEMAEEVKAITYHGLKVERRGDVWFCELIVDI